MENTPASRPYDIVVFGATGFTGGKTAEYLARNAGANVRWAIAGRSLPKLEALKAKLVELEPRCRDVGTVEASVDDPASLGRMAASTRVLLTTVGPFTDYGEPVVAACVQQGTDYIDSTGEPHFVQMLLQRYSVEATKKNVRLVSSCGFDSIPADLGVLFTVNQLPAGKPIRVSGYMKLKGVFSGGTERSAIKSMAAPPGAVAAAVPLVTAGRSVRLVATKVQHRPELGGWAAPLPTIDGSVVLRSASTLERYGPDFGYSHNYLHGSLGSLLAAAWVFGTLAILARFTAIREFLLKLVKKSGQGPTPEQMQQSWFSLRFVAECDGKILNTEVSGGDPGYGETSKMLAESALCLVEDRDALPARSGVLTTAECMGEALLARLQRVGPRFRVL